MRVFAVSVVFLLSFYVSRVFADAQPHSFHDLSATTIDGEASKLSVFQGKVVLVVNVASYCGYTPQYLGLEKLYEQYKERGLVVLGFPSNDFGQQEPGSDSEIKKFCSERFGVSFPLFSKTKVLGEDKHSVYRFLTASTGGADVGWNFEKFLVDRKGLVIGRFASGIDPNSSELKAAIEKALS
jgi:glutathione peroxidase